MCMVGAPGGDGSGHAGEVADLSMQPGPGSIALPSRERAWYSGLGGSTGGPHDAGSSRGGPMTYCLGITTKDGFVVASDSRSNAGYDQVNVCRKMHTFATPGDRVLVALTSGSLSCSQSIVTLLRKDFDAGAGLA